VANKQQDGDQYIPSVSGRYTLLDSTLYTWYDALKEDIRYKTQYYAYQQLKQGGNTTVINPDNDHAPIQITPNPFGRLIQIDLGGGEQEQVKRLSVYTVEGKKVTTIRPKTAQKQFTLHTQDWEPGIYLLKWQSAENSGVLKLVKTQ
jgi:hypothetical protein